jgi:hypothetical protein
MIELLDQVNGTGNYVGKQKKQLNPDIVFVLTELVESYNKIFIDNVIDPLQLQVFGENLNGVKNNGQLNGVKTCIGCN